MTDQEIHLDWTERNARTVQGQPNINRSLAYRVSKKYLPQPVKNAIKTVGWKLGLMKKSSFTDFNQMLPASQRR